MIRPRNLSLTLLAVCASLALTAPAANAGVLVSSATSCEDAAFEQPFLPWIDVASYVLTPGGTFEAGTAAWTLGGGAAVVNGNETYNVHGAGETKSLSLPSGSSATSPAMCVGIEHPTLRFFAKRTSGLIAGLAVEVLFEDAAGNTIALPIGVTTGLSSWQPSAHLAVIANLLPLLPGERTAVAFRFTALTGGYRIDDVYVDPYRKT